MGNDELSIISNEFIAKTRQQVAYEYDVSVRTLNRWLRNAHLKVPRGLITPHNLKKIYNTLGPPQR